MRIPQTADRIKEVPAQAVRALFAGVGQVLLLTERARRRALDEYRAAFASPPPSRGGTVSSPAQANGASEPSAVNGAEKLKDEPARTTTTQASGTGPATATPGTGKTSRTGPRQASTRVAGKTSTAKTGTPKASTARTGTPKARAARTGTPKASTVRTSTPKAETSQTDAPEMASPAAKADTPAAAAPTSTASVLPLPHYSELSLASLRARMRGLNAAQIRELIAYERAHEDRASIIAMFERRVAKLEEPGGAAD